MAVTQPEPSAAALAAAWAYLERERPQQALKALEQVDHGTPGFWEARASALHALELYDDAVAAAREGLTTDPDSLNLSYLLASGLTELNELGAAEHAVLSALRLAPDNSSLLSLYARMLASGNQLEKAHHVILEARRYEPDSVHVRATEAYVLWALGRDREAMRAARAVLAINPDHASGLAIVGMIQSDDGRHQQSFHRLRRMLGNNPALLLTIGEHLPAAQAASHRLMKPVARTMTPHGPAVTWLVAMITVMIGAALQNLWIVIGVALVYVAYALYGHIVYWTLLWYYKRRG